MESLLNFKLPTLPKLKNPQTGAIGLDMGFEQINLVQIDRIEGTFSIRAATSVGYPSGRDNFLASSKSGKRLIRSILRDHPFRGKKITTTLPADQIKLMLVNFQGHNTTEQLILKAVQERINTGLESSVIDYVVVNPRSENQSQQSALVAIADKQKIMDYLNWLNQCGLNVQVLEIGPIAINRLLCAMYGDHLEMKVLAINFGSKKSYLTVVWGRRLLLDRVIDYGLEQALDTVSKSLHIGRNDAHRLLEQHGFTTDTGSNRAHLIDGTDISQTLTEILIPFFRKLASEINEVLLYTASETRGGTIEQINLFGSLARIHHTDKILDKLLSLPVATVKPFYGFSVNKDLLPAHELAPVSGIAVATGLALRGLLAHA